MALCSPILALGQYKRAKEMSYEYLPFARMIGSPPHLVQDELGIIPLSPLCERLAS
jgi:hypothetical protein